jgi:type IV secretory pathway TrbL component
MSMGLNLKEMGVMMVVSIILLVLVNKIPPMLSGIIGGGAGGIGNLGAGAAIGAAAAATGVATGVMMASAANAAGGASAIKAAFDAAHSSMEAGAGMFSNTSPGGGQSGSGAPSGGLAPAMGTTARFAAETGSHLARGGMEAAKSSVASQGGRVAQTPGGKVASAIRANMPEPEFKGNAFSGSKETKLDPEAEAAAFRDSK